MAKKIRILSIDGGGIRGIIPAVILNEIEEKLRKKSGNDNARLQDYFDMIAGTSTGGILSCLYLHTKRFEAKDAVELYVKNGEKIFKPKGSVLFNWAVECFSSKYSATGLETALNDKFGNCRLSELNKCSLITAYDIVNRKAVLFTVPEAKENPLQHRDFYLKDIARATSAAPTYFEPAVIKSLGKETHNLIDGGMFANDPSLCALVEARKTHFENHSQPTIKDVYMVSLGTGKEASPLDPKKAASWGLLKWATHVVDILMTASPEVVSYQLKQLFDVAGCSDSYVRLQPGLYKAKPDMDDVSKANIANLVDAGTQYVKQNGEKLDKIVEQLLS